MTPPIPHDRWQMWRVHVFYACCLAYTGYYFCRKDFSKLPGLAVDRGEHMSVVVLPLFCFGAAYSLGQILSSWLVDRFGAARIMLSGALITGIATFSFGIFPQSRETSIVLESISGLGQGFGWVSALVLFGSWFQTKERGSVLGWWNGSYILGGIVAASFVSWNEANLHKFDLQYFSIDYGYVIPATVTLLTAFICRWLLRNIPNEKEAQQFTQQPSKENISAKWISVLGNKIILSISGMYFFLKMMRYTLLFWLPVYLMNSLGYSSTSAAGMAACFELSGAAGSILVVRSAQTWFNRNYFLTSGCYLAILAFICILHPLLSHAGWVTTVISVSLMGFIIHGVDLLMSGVFALESVPPELQSRAVGLVNAIGSLGQTLSALVVLWMTLTIGWNGLFNLFVIFALAAAAVCIKEHLHPSQTVPDRTVLNVLNSST